MLISFILVEHVTSGIDTILIHARSIPVAGINSTALLNLTKTRYMVHHFESVFVIFIASLRVNICHLLLVLIQFLISWLTCTQLLSVFLTNKESSVLYILHFRELTLIGLRVKQVFLSGTTCHLILLLLEFSY